MPVPVHFWLPVRTVAVDGEKQFVLHHGDQGPDIYVRNTLTSADTVC
jgi:hypothetical protein